MDLIGRKLSLQLIFIPFTIAWTITGFSNSVEMIYIGTFINGIAAGKSFKLSVKRKFEKFTDLG